MVMSISGKDRRIFEKMEPFHGNVLNIYLLLQPYLMFSSTQLPDTLVFSVYGMRKASFFLIFPMKCKMTPIMPQKSGRGSRKVSEHGRELL